MAMSFADEIFEALKKNKRDTLDYSFITQPPDDLNNVEAMHRFVEEYDLSNFIEEDDGTRVALKHPKYNFEIFIDSTGLGSFYNHGIYIYRDKR